MIVAAVTPRPASTQPPMVVFLSTIGFRDASSALIAIKNAMFLWLDRKDWMTDCDVEKMAKSSILHRGKSAYIDGSRMTI